MWCYWIWILFLLRNYKIHFLYVLLLKMVVSTNIDCWVVNVRLNFLHSDYHGHRSIRFLLWEPKCVKSFTVKLSPSNLKFVHTWNQTVYSWVWSWPQSLIFQWLLSLGVVGYTRMAIGASMSNLGFPLSSARDFWNRPMFHGIHIHVICFAWSCYEFQSIVLHISPHTITIDTL